MADELATLVANADETTIRVGLGERSYDIVIGEALLDSAGARIAAAVPGARCAVVSDTTVAGLYLERLKASLGGLFLGEVVVAPGEASKCFPVLAKVSEQLLELGVERGDAVVALRRRRRRRSRRASPPASSCAASTSSRSRPRCWPRSTPRSAARPASTPPKARTWSAPSISRASCSPTLACSTRSPPRELRAGYAEVVKYGLLGDAPFFAWLEASRPQIFCRRRPRARRGHRHELPRQGGDRRGRRARGERHRRAAQSRPHLRPCAGGRCGYSDRLLHGEAVAIGMRLAFTFSVAQRALPRRSTPRVSRPSRRCGPAHRHRQHSGASRLRPSACSRIWPRTRR